MQPIRTKFRLPFLRGSRSGARERVRESQTQSEGGLVVPTEPMIRLDMGAAVLGALLRRKLRVPALEATNWNALC